MIKFSRVTTGSKYTFGLALLAKHKYILTEMDEYNGSRHTKSLTNNIEHVLDHIVLGMFGNTEGYEFYQWCPNDGLFRLDFNLDNTKSIPWCIKDVKWDLISKDLKVFDLLYSKGV